jgi:Family of unknown function (DUF6644)
MDPMLTFANWLESWHLRSVMHMWYMWPTLEAIHFLGLALLLGPVLLLDLRMLGMAKQLPAGPLHKFVPWSLAGFGLVLITGISFIMGRPTNYVGNIFLYLKLPTILLAGINALLFYLTKTNQRVQALGPGEDAPLVAKVFAGASLFLWFSVIALGRMIGIYG